MKEDTTIHQAVWESLCRSIQRNTVSHAYLFEGSALIGKKTLARRFAMALQCESEDGEKPCLTCPSCLKHKAESHPDYTVLLPEPGKKTIAVRAVRDALEDLFVRPFSSKRKILFVPDAELCDASAQNAMLKCFEEPPPYAVILLTAQNRTALLETIRSRARTYTLSPCPRDTLCRFIEAHYPDRAKERFFIADLSSGVIGRAVQLLEDEDARQCREALFSLLCHMHESRYKALKVADFFNEHPDADGTLFECCLIYLKDVVLSALSGTPPLLISYAEPIAKAAASASPKAWSKALFSLAESRADKAKYAGDSLWITERMIHLWEVLND